MFTAKQAKELAGPSLEEKVECLLESIKRVASPPLKQRELRCGWEHKDHPSLWINGGYGRDADWHKAKKMLEDLGYKVSFYYNDGLFAVDMYTLVEW